MLKLTDKVFYLIYSGGSSFFRNTLYTQRLRRWNSFFLVHIICYYKQGQIIFQCFTILALMVAFAIDRKYVVFLGTNKSKPQTMNLVQHTCDFVKQVLSQAFQRLVN